MLFSLVVTPGHSWSLVVIRGHSCVLLDTIVRFVSNGNMFQCFVANMQKSRLDFSQSKSTIERYNMGGGHWGLRYCGIGQFFMRYFGNSNLKLRYCGILKTCGIRFLAFWSVLKIISQCFTTLFDPFPVCCRFGHASKQL